MQPQKISASGLVRPHVRDQVLRSVGTTMGRFDSRDGRFLARYDAQEDHFKKIALGVIGGLMGARLDAAESALVSRALVFVDKTPYATLIPPLLARTFIPTSVKGNPGDETYLWRKYTRSGIARLFAPGAALDLPRAVYGVEEITQRYYPVGVEIVYNYFELLAIGASLANGYPVDLVGESMRAALEAVEKKLDVIAAFGTATPPTGIAAEVEMDVGLTGLFNNLNATAYTIPAGAANGTQWSTKTADEILADLNGIVGGQIASTYMVHSPDTIIVPVAQFQQQLTRRMSDVSNSTVIEFFKKTREAMGAPVDVIAWDYAQGAGTAGADAIVAYKRDPRMFEHVLAMDAAPLSATTQGLETTQPVVAKTAGVVLRYPLSVSIGSGI